MENIKNIAAIVLENLDKLDAADDIIAARYSAGKLALHMTRHAFFTHFEYGFEMADCMDKKECFVERGGIRYFTII